MSRYPWMCEPALGWQEESEQLHIARVRKSITGSAQIQEKGMRGPTGTFPRAVQVCYYQPHTYLLSMVSLHVGLVLTERSYSSYVLFFWGMPEETWLNWGGEKNLSSSTPPVLKAIITSEAVSHTPSTLLLNFFFSLLFPPPSPDFGYEENWVSEVTMAMLKQRESTIRSPPHPLFLSWSLPPETFTLQIN